MPVRYIGRDPIHKGKSLFEICRQLRDFGVGRIVHEASITSLWPSQKTYFRLTKVVPNMTSAEISKGQAWGEYVFRGKDKGLTEITTGHQFNWILVPKEEEKEFCGNTEVFDVDTIPVTDHIDCPPLLQMVLKQELKAKGREVPEKIKVPFVSTNYRQELEWSYF